MGDFFEIGVGKPYKIRAENSEKLLSSKGGERQAYRRSSRIYSFKLDSSQTAAEA